MRNPFSLHHHTPGFTVRSHEPQPVFLRVSLLGVVELQPGLREPIQFAGLAYSVAVPASYAELRPDRIVRIDHPIFVAAFAFQIEDAKLFVIREHIPKALHFTVRVRNEEPA
jgi:hypothetical protein